LFDDLFVGEGFGGVEDNEDKVACAGCGDDLTTATFAFGSSFDDSGKI